MKIFALLLMLGMSAMSAVVVIITAINCDYLCECCNNYFLPFFVMFGFTAASGIALYSFILQWNQLFLKK